MSSYKETLVEKIEVRSPKLRTPKLPLVVDDWTLSFRLGFRGKVFWFVHKNRDSMYKEFRIRKATGGMRVIHNPSPLMRTFSQQLRTRILLPLCAELGEHVSAYQLGKSTIDAAKEHLAPCDICAPYDVEHTCNPQVVADAAESQKYKVVKTDCVACSAPPVHDCPRKGVKIHMDIKNFFGSTRRSWIRQYFQEAVGYNHYVSGLLAHLMTVSLKNPKSGDVYNGVPQGSKTSGDICNLVADWRFDREIKRKYPEWKYTRYADDLYFSHPKNLTREETDAFIKGVESIITASGYRVNSKKLHVQRPFRRQMLLGVVLNQKLNIPKEQFRQMRSLLHNCVWSGFASQVDRAKRDSVENLHHWIRGKISYYAMISPSKAARLKVVYQHACQLEKVNSSNKPAEEFVL